MKNKLLGAIIGLCKLTSTHPGDDETMSVIMRALRDSISDDEALLNSSLEMVHEERDRLAPSCRYCQARCDNGQDYDMALLESNPETKPLKEKIISFLQQGAKDNSLPSDIYIKALTWVGIDLEKEYYSELVESIEKAQA